MKSTMFFVYAAWATVWPNVVG